MKRAHEEGEREKRMRLRIKERVSDLIESDILLRQEKKAEGAAVAGEPREAFNTYVKDFLPRLAGRSCFRGDDRKEFQDEVLRIIRDMYEGGLHSEAFSRCLERHCRNRMDTFDSEAWRVKAMHVFWTSEEVNRATSQ